jgi:hypothetical protein
LRTHVHGVDDTEKTDSPIGSARNVIWKAAVNANCHREKSRTVCEGPDALASVNNVAAIIDR